MELGEGDSLDDVRPVVNCFHRGRGVVVNCDCPKLMCALAVVMKRNALRGGRAGGSRKRPVA